MNLIKDVLNALSFLSKKRAVGFVVAGAQKSGTSALHFYLQQNEDICMANKKEVHFFDRDYFFFGLPNYLAYYRHFKPMKHHKIIGEATPAYVFWEKSMRRMWKYNREMKIVLILRNPVDRAYSHWNMERRRGRETLEFLDAIKLESDRSREQLPSQDRVFSYIGRGFYSEQIRRIERYFPKGQCMYVKYESFCDNPSRVMEKIFLFLGVASCNFAEKIVHAGVYQEDIRPEARDLLNEIFYHEIKQVETMLGWDCSDWLSVDQVNKEA